MAKLIIRGDLKEQDIWIIAKFFREFWRKREEKIFLYILEGTTHLTTEQVQGIFRKIFNDKDEKDWTEMPLNEEMINKWRESLK